MRLAALALCLMAPLASPASADTTHTTACSVHGADQMRCAQRAPLQGNIQGTAALLISGDGRISGDVQLWTSVCGVPGQAQGVRRVTNANGQVNFTANVGGCVEIFIFNCRDQGHQPVPCQRGFGTAQIATTPRL